MKKAPLVTILLSLCSCGFFKHPSPPTPPPAPPPIPEPPPPVADDADLNKAFDKLVGPVVAGETEALRIVGFDWEGQHFAVFHQYAGRMFAMVVTNGKASLVPASNFWVTGIRLVPPCAYSNVTALNNVFTNLGMTDGPVNPFTNAP